jgi:predicted outer membrane repeat protein
LEERRLLATFSVTNLNDSGAGSLRQAIIDANSTGGADDIVFQSGLTGTIALTSGEMSITESVTITGNGATDSVIDAQQASRIFNVDSGTIDVTLTDLTLSNGEITSGSPASGGAVRFVSSGTLAVSQSVLTNNFANNQGGAIFSPLGSVVVSGSTLTSNSTNVEGGAIYAQSGPVSVTDSTLSSNSSVFGGAIEAGQLTINRSELAGNSANTGGAIGAVSLDMEESTLSLNSATLDGGAIYALGAATVTQSTFFQNIAARGGAIYAVDGPVTVLQSTLDRNLSNDSNSNFSGNAIYSQSAHLTIQNSIIASQNDVSRSVVRPSPDGGDAFVVEFSLIGTNVGTSLTATGATTPDGNGNLIGDSAGIAPGTGALADNGGPTSTIELLPGSPALNRGSNAIASGLTADQRGAPFARVFDGTVDMGAFENQILSLVVDTNVDEDDGDYSAGDLSL